MLSAKSLGVGKQLPLDEDNAYQIINPFASELNAYKNLSDGFAQKNRYECNINGYMVMNNCTITEAQNIMGLNVMLSKETNILIAKGNKDFFPLYVSRSGYIKMMGSRSFDDGEYVYVVGTLPISTGGGLLNRVISFLRSHRLGVLGC